MLVKKSKSAKKKMRRRNCMFSFTSGRLWKLIRHGFQDLRKICFIKYCTATKLNERITNVTSSRQCTCTLLAWSANHPDVLSNCSLKRDGWKKSLNTLSQWVLHDHKPSSTRSLNWKGKTTSSSSSTSFNVKQMWGKNGGKCYFCARCLSYFLFWFLVVQFTTGFYVQI